MALSLTWAVSAFCPASDEVEPHQTVQQSQLIPRLIEQLGSDKYLIRREAEARLLNLGTAAFDDLQAAEQSSDLEVASRARYLLFQIRVQWVRPDDPPIVRKLLKNYGTLSVAERRERIDLVTAKADDLGPGPLCRMARFDPSPRLARYAALAVLSRRDAPEAQLRTTILEELGEGQSVPVKWLRVYADQLQDSTSLDKRWLPLIDAEVALVRQEAEETELTTVFRLLRYHLELSLQATDAQAIFATLQRRTDLIVDLPRAPHEVLYEKLNRPIIEALISNLSQFRGTAQAPVALAALWTIEHQQWEALRLLEDHYRQAFQKDRLLLYVSAFAQGQQGNRKISEELAERAFQIELDDANLNNVFADIIGELGRHDWAEREWQYVIDTAPITEPSSLWARSDMALYRLHDRGEDQAAAALLDEALQALEASPKTKVDLTENRASRNRMKALRAQQEYCLASHYKAQGDFEAQRKHLDEALKYNPADPDILIAMYHLEDADEEYHQKVRRRILSICRNLELAIEKTPSHQRNLNHWAWLVSNTEGDFQKAIEYSHRSLKLAPGSASYLDTLGRCYYAAGDLENALHYQRQAVAKHPHLQVMQRQLALFEKEFAARQ
ncbi:MAG: hypothetical protein MI725_12260 [Pirellulales bacterium]|nr:hypothetical protein [Pirellulales bacterium]